MRKNARVPLRVGDVWVLIGPKTEVTIKALAPRPTPQKPHAQAVTLEDGRTLAEATLRGNYMERARYARWLVGHAERCRLAFAEIWHLPAYPATILVRLPTAQVIPFPADRSRRPA